MYKTPSDDQKADLVYKRRWGHVGQALQRAKESVKGLFDAFELDLRLQGTGCLPALRTRRWPVVVFSWGRKIESAGSALDVLSVKGFQRGLGLVDR